MSDAYRPDFRSGRIATPVEPLLHDADLTLEDTLSELATTLAGIVGAFVIVLAAVGWFG
jgi:hypothetical protein